MDNHLRTALTAFGAAASPASPCFSWKFSQAWLAAAALFFGEANLGYATLIDCLQRITTSSAIYRHRPPSSGAHSALKDALIEGYVVLATQEHDDPIVDGVRPQILQLCRSIVRALDSGGMEFAPEASSRHMANEFCAELSALASGLMPYLLAMETEGHGSVYGSKIARNIEVFDERRWTSTTGPSGSARHRDRP